MKLFYVCKQLDISLADKEKNTQQYTKKLEFSVILNRYVSQGKCVIRYGVTRYKKFFLMCHKVMCHKEGVTRYVTRMNEH